MEEKYWIDYLTAIGSIATPILVIVLSAIAWKLRKGIERHAELEDKLRDDRIEIYNKILEPFVIFLMTEAAWETDKKHKGKDKNLYATNLMLTLEYRRLGFKMSLMGSDSVVKSYNNLMQYFYQLSDPNAEPSDKKLKEMWRSPEMKLIQSRAYDGKCTDCKLFIEGKCNSCLGRYAEHLDNRDLLKTKKIHTTGCFGFKEQ